MNRKFELFYLFVFLTIFTPTGASAETGSIYVISQPPGAEISLDGNPTQERTDVLIDSMPVGTHKITLACRNYGRVEKEIEIRGDLTATVHMDFEPRR